MPHNVNKNRYLLVILAFLGLVILTIGLKQRCVMRYKLTKNDYLYVLRGRSEILA